MLVLVLAVIVVVLVVVAAVVVGVRQTLFFNLPVTHTMYTK